MPKVSTKRQVTLPIIGCDELGIQAGDGAAAGLLKGTKANTKVTDEDSLQGHFA